jgi:hypothetical protein
MNPRFVSKCGVLQIVDADTPHEVIWTYDVEWERSPVSAHAVAGAAARGMMYLVTRQATMWSLTPARLCATAIFGLNMLT